jgi:hypothetical protein
VPYWVGEERLLASDCALEVDGRDFPFLREAVGKDRDVLAVEEVEDAVVTFRCLARSS